MSSPGALGNAGDCAYPENSAVNKNRKAGIRCLANRNLRLAGLAAGLSFVGAVFLAVRLSGDSTAVWVMAALGAALAGVRIGAAQERLRRQTVTDPLTALYNRRYLFSHLEYEVERARRYQSPVSLLILDVDSFKKINDTMGHMAGDAILKEIARVIKGTIRRSDWAARWGGEEFGVVLPSTDCQSALMIAERLRREIEARVQEALPASKRRPITVSIGLSTSSCLRGSEEGADDIVGRADQAMYRAKRWGNHVSNKCEAPWDSCLAPGRGSELSI